MEGLTDPIVPVIYLLTGLLLLCLWVLLMVLLFFLVWKEE